jgi:hypothetical protein
MSYKATFDEMKQFIKDYDFKCLILEYYDCMLSEYSKDDFLELIGSLDKHNESNKHTKEVALIYLDEKKQYFQGFDDKTCK